MVTIRRPLDIEWKAITFQSTPLQAGKGTLCIGPYVGPYTYAISALRSVRGAFHVPLYYLLGTVPPSAPPGMETVSNIFHGMSAQGIEGLQNFPHKLDRQQRDCVDAIGRCAVPLLPIRAVCGAGKSVVLVGSILWARNGLQGGEALACLAPNRNQREQMVRSLRRYLPVEDVMSLGRQEEGSTGEPDNDFDSFVERRVAEHFSDTLKALKSLTDALATITANRDLRSPDGESWMTQTTKLTEMAFLHWRQKEQFISELYKHVKIWCFTVDCFLQTQSADSMYRQQFGTIKIRAAFTEECHQLSLIQVAAVSATVPQHAFVYDPAQTIDHYEGGRARAENALFRQGDQCPWEHYICPVSPEQLDVALPEELVFRLTWSWRLGSEMCKFMRETTPPYNTDTTKLVSASDFAHDLTTEEQARAPCTVLQFVLVHNASYAVVAGRSPRYNVPIPARGRGNSTTSEARVYACEEIFYLALLEGLHVLGQALNGQFYKKGCTEPCAVRPGDIVIETILYMNTARRTFLELVQGALTHAEVRNHFRIPSGNPGGHWHVKTPEGCSGDTAWWQQLVVMPRAADGADVAGNMKSSGRRVVGQSRGTYGNTNYLAAECFAAEGPRTPKDTWKQQHQVLLEGTYSRWNVTSWKEVPLDSPGLESCPEFRAERQAALALLQAAVPLSDAVARALKSSDEVRGRALPDAIRALLADVARGASEPGAAAVGVLVPSEPGAGAVGVPVPPTFGPRAGELINDDAEDAPVDPMAFWSREQVVGTAALTRTGALEQLTAHLVPWPTVTIKNGSVQIVFLVLDATLGADGRSPTETVERVVSAGREIALAMWKIFSSEPDLHDAVAALVPHKLKILKIDSQSIALRECWSDRQAFVLVPRRNPQGNQAVLYTYIGGGVPHQPPNTYPLVFRNMPLHIGACLAAVGAALIRTELRTSMIYCRDMKLPLPERTRVEIEFFELYQRKREQLAGTGPADAGRQR